MTVLDNCLAYLRAINEEEGLNLSAAVIEREAHRMAEAMISARQAFMDHQFDREANR